MSSPSNTDPKPASPGAIIDHESDIGQSSISTIDTTAHNARRPSIEIKSTSLRDIESNGADEESLPPAPPETLGLKLRRLMRRFRRKKVVIAFIVFQLVMYFSFWSYYRFTSEYASMRALLGETFPLARGAAWALNVDISLSQTNFLNQLGFDIHDRIKIHKMLGYSIITFVGIHVCCHLRNFYMALPEVTIKGYFELLFTSGTGATGWIAFFALLIIVSTAIAPGVRRRNYEAFYYLHHLLVVFYGAVLAHGAFCFLKADNEPVCRGPYSWRFLIVPGLLYLIDRGIRLMGKEATIKKVILHPSNVMEVQFHSDKLKPPMYPGAHVRICCPTVSSLQWHSFSLTTGPYDDYMSVHISVCGNWTSAFRAHLQRNVAGPKDILGEVYLGKQLPKLLVDGPYASPFDQVWNYPVVILASGGIGATPFASILRHVKSMLARGEKPVIKKMVMVWTCRDLDSFKWFTKQIAEIESIEGTEWIEFRLHWSTKKEITDEVIRETSRALNVRAKTYFGRPDWKLTMYQVHRKHPGHKVGIFICGPSRMTDQIKLCAEELNDVENLFRVYTERF